VSNGSTLELTGYVDQLRRPLVRLVLVGLESDVLALVDTGCNMYMVTTQSVAREANLTNTGIKEGGELAAGAATFELFEGKVRWFGKDRDIVVHVPLKEPVQLHERDDDPRVIIGTRLLRFSHLSVSFFEQDSFGAVRIYRNPTSHDE
jgi:predicted aspartyl protease